MKFWIFILFFVEIQGFIRLPLGSPFIVKNKEIQRKINIDHLQQEDQIIVREMNGVYGLIGPDLHIPDIENLYHLFTGNGMIQACFFDKGELTFVTHYVRTEKLIYEEECGKVLYNRGIYLLFVLLNKINLLPNILGLANTAVVNINKKYYALYERDVPYEIFFDFSKKCIETGNKQNIKGIQSFSAHPTLQNQENLVETIQYNIIKNSVSFYQLTSDLVLQKTIETPTTYLPIVHDFISTQYNYIMVDAPLAVKFSEMHTKPIPVSLMKDQPTFIRIINKNTGRVRTYKTTQSFYVFHYAQIYETNDVIKIYAPLYDDIDFSTLDIKGRYRELVLDKYSDNVTINKNEELENLNLDFPMPYEDKIVLRNIKDRVCDGFVICRNLEIVHKIYIENRFVCGEPRIIYIKGVPYLLFFTLDIGDSEQGYIMLINLQSYREIEMPIGVPIKYGFHSFFYDEKIVR
jgi:hypothetical protein